MNLEVENFYELGQGEFQNWVWRCEKDYEYPAYKYEENITLEEMYNIADSEWLVSSFVEKPTPDTFDVLFQKKPTENCFWFYAEGNNALPTYTLVATPVKDAEVQPGWSFLINKNWTYGDITTNLLLILLLGLFVWDMFRRIFKTRFRK